MLIYQRYILYPMKSHEFSQSWSPKEPAPKTELNFLAFLAILAASANLPQSLGRRKPRFENRSSRFGVKPSKYIFVSSCSSLFCKKKHCLTVFETFKLAPQNYANWGHALFLFNLSRPSLPWQLFQGTIPWKMVPGDHLALGGSSNHFTDRTDPFITLVSGHQKLRMSPICGLPSGND